MKTLFKVVLVLAAIVGALWWLAVVLLNLTAGAQTRAALQALNEGEGLTAEADEIRLYLDGVGARNLQLTADEGDRLSVERVRLRVSVWPLLWGGDLDVREVSVQGLRIDLAETDWSRQHAEAPPAPLPEDLPPGVEPPADAVPERERRIPHPARERFEGLLAETQHALPRMRLRRADIDGSLHFSDDQHVALHITARGIAPGTPGRVQASLDGHIDDPQFPVRTGELHLDLRVQQSAAGGLEGLDGEARLGLLARNETEPVQLSAELSLQRSTGGERYRLRVRREGIPAALVDLDAEWQPQHQRLEGNLALALTAAALAEIPRWNGPLVPIEGRLEFAMVPPVVEPAREGEGSFRFQGTIDLAAWSSRPASGFAETLQQGVARLDVQGRSTDGHGRASGSVDLEGLRPPGHTDAPFALQHQTEARWTAGHLRLGGPVVLTGPSSESRGRLLLETEDERTQPRLRLELDHFDEEEWAPLLERLPGPMPDIHLTGAR